MAIVSRPEERKKQTTASRARELAIDTKYEHCRAALRAERETDNKTGTEEPELGGSSRINKGQLNHNRLLTLHITLLQQDKSKCDKQLSAKLVIATPNSNYSLVAFLPMIRKIADDDMITSLTNKQEVTTQILMADPFQATYTGVLLTGILETGVLLIGILSPGSRVLLTETRSHPKQNH